MPFQKIPSTAYKFNLIILVVFIFCYEFYIDLSDASVGTFRFLQVSSSVLALLFGLLIAEIVAIILWLILLIRHHTRNERTLMVFAAFTAVNSALFFAIGVVFLSFPMVEIIAIIHATLFAILAISFFVFGAYSWNYRGRYASISEIIIRLFQFVIVTWVVIYYYLVIFH